MGAATGAIGGLAGAADSVVPAATAAMAANQQNQMSEEQLARQNAFNANQADIAWQRNEASAGRQRDWSQNMWNLDAQFNSAEAQKARDFNEFMSNTAYQRATNDMKLAGINPMLAASQGGASNPGGPSASAGTASGATGSGPSATAANSPLLQSGLAAAVNTGMTADRLSSDLKSAQSMRDLQVAQTAKTLADVDQSHASAYMLQQTGDKMLNEIPVIQQNLKLAIQNTENERLRAMLINAQRDLTISQGQISDQTRDAGLPALNAKILGAKFALMQAAIPGAQNEAAMQGTWVGKVAPYLGVVNQGISGAAKAAAMFAE